MAIKEFNPTSYNQLEDILLLRDYLKTKAPASVTPEQCFLKATAIFELINQMENGVVKFYYLKTDGTLRQATGTLQNLEQRLRRRNREANYGTQVYFDTIAGEFRCFKKENLVINLNAAIW